MMEPILITLEAGGSTYPDNPHEGEEFGYVLQGSINIHIGSKTYRAKKGESFYFTPDKALPYEPSRRIADLGQHAAKLLKLTGANIVKAGSPLLRGQLHMQSAQRLNITM